MLHYSKQVVTMRERLSIFILVIIMNILFTNTLEAQTQLNFNDTTIIYQDARGNVMPTDSIISLFKKGPVMMVKKQPIGGKDVYVLLPQPKDEENMKAFSDNKIKEDWLNKPFPVFDLPTLTNIYRSNADLKGKVVVINFWFTGCKPCVAEMPQLNQLVTKYSGQPVEFLSITFNDKSEIENFLKKHDFNFTHIPSAKDLIEQLGIVMYPTNIILNEQGVVKEIIIGALESIDARLTESIERVKGGK